MKSMVQRAWGATCQELSAIIYGTYLRIKLRPRFKVQPGERLSPFLFHSNEYDPGKKIVRHPAFTPSRRLRKSAYWTSKLLDGQIWSIGARFVAPLRGLPIKARADLKSTVVYDDLPLKVKLTSKPHPRHVDIVGWSGERKKDRLHAVKLADESKLVIYPAAFAPSTRDVDEDAVRKRVAQTVLLMIIVSLIGSLGWIVS